MQNEISIKPKRVSKACDACKARKVRCNGGDRCQQCENQNLKCLYTSHARRGGSRKNAAGRGTVIAEYRKQTNFNAARSGQILLSPARDSSSSAPPPTLPTSNHPDPAFFLRLLPTYVTSVYPMYPVITEPEIQSCVAQMDHNREYASFLYAFAAVTGILTKTDFLQNDPNIHEQLANLVTRSLECRNAMGLETSTQPTLLRVLTSLFIQSCFMSLRKPSLGFYYLRDAVAMVQMLRIQSPDALSSIPVSERAKHQRAYWQCFIHERFMALAECQPPVLDPLPELPDFDPSLPLSINEGWNLIIQTFLPVDKQFIAFWIGDRSAMTLEWVETKHGQLSLDDSDWQLAISVLSELQQADLIITRQWLRTLLWQMALSNVLLSPDHLTLPLRLSNALRRFLERLGRHAVGAHGSGILYKLFEIADSIADVVIHLPDASRDATLARVDDILFLKDFVFGFDRIEDVHRKVLMGKFALMREKYPEMEEIRTLVGAPGGLAAEVPSEALHGDEWSTGLAESEFTRSRVPSWVGFLQAL